MLCRLVIRSIVLAKWNFMTAVSKLWALLSPGCKIWNSSHNSRFHWVYNYGCRKVELQMQNCMSRPQSSLLMHWLTITFTASYTLHQFIEFFLFFTFIYCVLLHGRRPSWWCFLKAHLSCCEIIHYCCMANCHLLPSRAFDSKFDPSHVRFNCASSTKPKELESWWEVRSSSIMS